MGFYLLRGEQMRFPWGGKKLEKLGIDPNTYRMLSGRSTI
jgi:hypothetical protein